MSTDTQAENRRAFLVARKRSTAVELTMTVLTVATAVLIAFLVVLAASSLTWAASSSGAAAASCPSV